MGDDSSKIMKNIKDTPLNRQYKEIKAQYNDAIVFFRVGDFYEVFYDDAELVSKELNIVLTSRQEGQPMAGVPHHSLDRYLNTLVKNGYKVAICDQIEDPKKAKGIVKRDVVKVVTPGTLIDDYEDCFLFSIVEDKGKYYYSYVDISIGEIYTGVAENTDSLLAILRKNDLKEVIISEDAQFLRNFLEENFPKIYFSYMPPWEYDKSLAEERIKNYFNVVSLVPFNIHKEPMKIVAIGVLLKYIEDTQKGKLKNICRLESESDRKYLFIDAKTWKNLEIFSNMQNNTEENTLVSVLNQNYTGMGIRTLKSWLKKPLLDEDELILRYDSVEYFLKNGKIRDELRDILKNTPDFEKSLGKISYEKGKPKDLIQIKKGLFESAKIQNLFAFCDDSYLESLIAEIEPLDEIYELLERSLVEDSLSSIGSGKLFKSGYNEKYDKLRELKENSRSVLVEIQEREKKKTGIPTLKVKYNKVFGYFIEISKTHRDKVPDYYERKQTLVNAERYITEELKELEYKILSADEELSLLEEELFAEIKSFVLDNAEKILKNAEIIGKIDTLLSFASVALEYDYCRPEIVSEPLLQVIDGRHPVIERLLKNDEFVPNDLFMTKGERDFLLITGPNMAGKSTYLRQNALMILMAQIGAFVPATKMRFSLVDKIFSRVGASDNLSAGESTFMTEMLETAYILRNATEKSFVILDEIGRGTSTYDGLSLAWAISEHIYKNIGAKTIFATHYHELTELEDIYDGIKNLNILIREWNDKIIFLRKIEDGKADKSYGIQVARLAGLPDMVIERAKEILLNLEIESYKDGKPTIVGDEKTEKNRSATFDLFSNSFEEKIVNRIRYLDLDRMTPVALMYEIDRLKKEIDEHDKKA